MFFLSFTGWVLETAQESIVRKKFVSKGFFKGPYIPLHGIGAIFVYMFCSRLKAYPAAVFFIGASICTVAEYLAALFLEACFKVKCWDYQTYPHTRWCHFQGRICLTTSVFFGLASLFLVYFYWDFITNAALRFFLERGGISLLLLDGVFVLVFLVDAVFACARILRAKKSGNKIKGWAVFSGTDDAEQAAETRCGAEPV
jgi:uncharacterized membrane protein